jgi:histidine triad (HIT) family protein
VRPEEAAMMPCVFCEIVSGVEPARLVARRTSASAFLPLLKGRLAPLHTLVVPNRHVPGIVEAEEVDVLLNASGPHSEQSVPHLHFHVVPRWMGDGFTTWPASRSQHQLPESASRRLSEALDVL